MTPVLLLDIDGVINGHPRLCGWGRPPRREKVSLPIYYEPQVIDRLRTLHTSNTVEVRWCTTWCGIPMVLDQLSRVLDLPFEPAFGDRPMSKTWGDMKLEAALAVLDEDRRLIWVDDEEATTSRPSPCPSPGGSPKRTSRSRRSSEAKPATRFGGAPERNRARFPGPTGHASQARATEQARVTTPSHTPTDDPAQHAEDQPKD